MRGSSLYLFFSYIFDPVLLYFACNPEELHGVAEHRVLCHSLEDAQRLKSEMVLVLDRNPLGDLRRVGTVYHHAGNIPQDAILNLDPYAPPRTVIAGGGIVRHRGTGELLCIRRHGVLDLPKGKQDPGETVAECAMRELKEETGASDLCQGRLLGTTVHGYRRSGFFEIKTTYWYAFLSEMADFVPAVEESIEEVFWVPYEQAEKTLGYAPLRDFLTDVRSACGKGLAGFPTDVHEQ